MEWFRKIFSEPVDFSRVNELGIAIMAIGVLVVMLASKLARLFQKEVRQPTVLIIKAVGLVICAGGALVAIIAK